MIRRWYHWVYTSQVNLMFLHHYLWMWKTAVSNRFLSLHIWGIIPLLWTFLPFIMVLFLSAVACHLLTSAPFIPFWPIGIAFVVVFGLFAPICGRAFVAMFFRDYEALITLFFGHPERAHIRLSAIETEIAELEGQNV